MYKEKHSRFLDNISKTLNSEDVLWEKEVRANVMLAVTFLYFIVFMAFSWIASEVGWFLLPLETIRIAAPVVMLELAIPAVLVFVYKGRKKWLKIVILFVMVFVFSRIDQFLTYNVPLNMVIPVVASILYCSKKLTRLISWTSGIFFAQAAWSGAKNGMLDLNYVDLPIGTELKMLTEDLADAVLANPAFSELAQAKSVLLYGFLPKLFVYAFICLICGAVAGGSHKMIIEQAEISEKTARMSSELNLATDIQANMLPKTFPQRKEFEVYASMTPAREVGGDLYDCYLLDDDHLVLSIADVSGKGVPASLFMVTAKTLFKDFAYQGMTPGGIFTKANNILSDGNDAELFVTGWMAIIDLRTGVADFCNAGHNPPIVKWGENGYSYLRTTPSLVLAAMPGIKYKTQHLTLAPGDVLYLYTDGVPEAINIDNEQYGEQRLIDCLTKNDPYSTETICKNIKADVDEFAGEIEQFDDITMIAIKFHGTTDQVAEAEAKETN